MVFLAAVPKVAALVVLIRIAVAMDLATVHDAWIGVAASVAVASQTIGNLVAAVQRDLKRMLAYAGVAHIGYALIAVIAGGASGSSAVVFYLAAYTVMMTGAFAAVTQYSHGEEHAHFISELAGEGWRRPWLGAGVTVLMVSLAGFPATVGFTAKFVVFSAAIQADLAWLAMIGVANSVIAAFVYLNVVATLYLRPSPSVNHGFSDSRGAAMSVLATALGALILGLYPTPLISAAEAAARTLLR
jgi:NADH-quinone oxidoreductase subunit N